MLDTYPMSADYKKTEKLKIVWLGRGGGVGGECTLVHVSDSCLKMSNREKHQRY